MKKKAVIGVILVILAIILANISIFFIHIPEVASFGEYIPEGGILKLGGLFLSGLFALIGGILIFI
jgi:hypothetical protein